MKSFLRVWLGISLMAIGIGIAILVIAFASGASWDIIGENADFVTLNEHYEGVKSLDVDVDYGIVNVVEGDSFKITAKNILEGEVKSYVEGDTWYIREDRSSWNKIFNDDFFVWQFIYRNNYMAPHITITVPKGFEASSYSFAISKGIADIEAVNAKEGNFHVDAGELDIDRLNISDKSSYKIGAGQMTLDDISVRNINVDCGVGNCEINGAITGDNKIKCGVGCVKLNLDGEEEDYSYDVECGLGNVDIDGESYRDYDDLDEKGNTDRSLNLDCGIGNISVDFN